MGDTNGFEEDGNVGEYGPIYYGKETTQTLFGG